MLTSEQLKNLPEDTRKEYLKTLLLLDAKKKKQEVKDDFLSFVKHMWQDLLKVNTIRVWQKNLIA